MSAFFLNNGSATGRGRLEVFLGYAAGVGKTYRMLQEAQRRKEEGVDVVLGYFEPHGRIDTNAMAEGLELIPRRKIEYRGTQFDEMDTEAVLARSPEVCAVDEFAHTNVPGSARPKRWQDVEVIRDAGIDVLTTVNVQHLESLNDQVWHFTGVRVRETIPDWAVQQADEIVFVDVTPRALIHRLERGVVYKPDKALSALENFFTEANLTALRELAMRQTAHQIEESLEQAPGPDRVLIQITPDPSTAMLIRRGKRVADYLQSECIAVFVAKHEDWHDLSPEGREAIERHLNFARIMHIPVHVISGSPIHQRLVAFAREHGIQRIYVSRTSAEAQEIVAHAPDMIVTVVAERKRPA